MLKRLAFTAFYVFVLTTGGPAHAQSLSSETIAQQALKDLGYPIGTVDGIWGPKSTTAMKEFQVQAGLPPTGIPDLSTLEVLTAPSQPEPDEPDHAEAIAAPVAPAEPVSSTSATRDRSGALTLGFQAGIENADEPAGDNVTSPAPQPAIVSPPRELAEAVAPPQPPESVRPSQQLPAPATKPASPASTGDDAEPDFVSFLVALGLPSLLVYWFFSRRGRLKKEAALRASSRNSTYSILDLADDGPISPVAKTAPTQPYEDRNISPVDDRKAQIAAHNAAVHEVIRTRSQASIPTASDTEVLATVKAPQPQVSPRENQIAGAIQAALGLSPATRSTPVAPAARGSEKNNPWVAGSQSVQIGQHNLRKGLVYVGDRLKTQKGWPERENCLIVPSMPVASRGDTSGQYLDYWPSYETLTPSSRKAYLDWLASNRSEPSTPIGYVFLYFYGLERRLMLDRSDEDRAEIIAEVNRLLQIYGQSRSFERYANELLSAADIMYNGLDNHELTRPQLGGGTVPIAVRIEIGRRAALGQSIGPELLLSLTVNHPETRIRTPARRLFHLLGRRFVERVTLDHPNGLTIALPRNPPKLQPTYRAASNTFEVSIVPESSGFPDVANLPQPLGYGRKLLEAITDELDGYSRELGRTGGVATTLSSLAKLPPDLARDEALALPGAPLTQLRELASNHQMVKSADLARIAGINGEGATKTRLKELAQCLRTWDLGIVPDPAFAPKIVADWNDAIVFHTSPDEPMPPGPTQHYQMAYLTLALGVLVAQSDGEVSDAERNLLGKVILESPGLNGSERRRLVSEARWLEAHPYAVGDLRQWLKDSSEDFRKTVMQNLFPVAGADGRLAGQEVTALEKISKLLGFENSSVYEGLAGNAPSSDDDIETVETAKIYNGQPIPLAPKPAATGLVNHELLAAVRANTKGSTQMLSDIFADEEEEVALPTPPPPHTDSGLDSRHRALLDELLTRPEWSKADFEGLVRQAGLMPGSVITTLNEWSLSLCDELVLEGDNPVMINTYAVLESA